MFNAVFGSPQANSYVRVQEATDHLALRYGGNAWSDLTDGRTEEQVREIRESLLATASRLVDTATFRFGKFFDLGRGFGFEQALKLPWSSHPHLRLRAASGTEAIILLDDPAFPGRYLPEFFIGGSVVVVQGTNRGQAASVATIDPTSRAIGVDPPFAEAVDSTTEFFLLAPPEQAVVAAVIEQAYHLLLVNPLAEAGEADGKDPLYASGIVSFRIAGIAMDFTEGIPPTPSPALCNTARLLLRPYLAGSVGAGRA